MVQLQLAETREKAQRLIRAGQVEVDGRMQTKPGRTTHTESDIRVREQARFVSRGGEKLEAAFRAFGIDVSGLVCVDIGSSTGGFTDCLLQHGAGHVYAVDVGKGQFHWKLRNDVRVTVMEGVNARYLEPEDFDPRPSFAVVDVSFISLTRILPALTKVLSRRAEIVTLVKPQFEAGRSDVGKGGVVRDPAVRENVISKIRSFGENELGLVWRGICESPVKGPAGNVEFPVYWEKS